MSCLCVSRQDEPEGCETSKLLCVAKGDGVLLRVCKAYWRQFSSNGSPFFRFTHQPSVDQLVCIVRREPDLVGSAELGVNLERADLLPLAGRYEVRDACGQRVDLRRKVRIASRV